MKNSADEDLKFLVYPALMFLAITLGFTIWGLILWL